MKLYYAPGACSLADHIALHEGGISFEHEKVDLKTKTTASGADFKKLSPKGYVPLVVLDNGETLSENIAILDWITRRAPKLSPDGDLGPTRHLEALAYISTEIHKSFAPFFSGAGDDEKNKARDKIEKRLQYLADTMKGDYLFGANLSAADCYLFVMLLWADKNDVATPEPLKKFSDRMKSRDAVRTAMQHEGLA